MDAREQRGLEIAALSKIVKASNGYVVPSQSGNGVYRVAMNGVNPTCTCPDFEARRMKCKHLWAVEYVIRREEKPDGTTITTEAVRVTYRQDWPAYNAAQTHEQEHFVSLLHDLCNSVPQPPQHFGRPKLPISDAIFGAVFKVYSTMSGRRVMAEIWDAQARGLLDKAPSFTSTFRYLESPDVTSILKALIERSSLPMQSIETAFAADSTGFSTSTYARWFDHKWGKERSKHTWVKAHAMVGTKTHIVTAVEATPGESADSPQFPGLVNKTAENFNVAEVSADKAYLSKKNLRVVEAVGGTAYIPFKVNTDAPLGAVNGEIVPIDNSAWARMYHFFAFNQQTFLEHYHKRSNVESAFSMMKAKFGGAVRAKTPTAQVNEVLCKVLCHNICVVIQSWYELGIAPLFEAGCSKSEVAVPNVAWE